MPAITVTTAYAQVLPSESTALADVVIRSDLLSEKSTTTYIANASAPSKHIVFAGLTIALGVITIAIILGFVYLRFVKRDTQAAKLKGLKPLLLVARAAHSTDLEKCSNLASVPATLSHSPVLVSASPLVSPSAPSPSPLTVQIYPSIKDELFSIASEYQSWIFKDCNDTEYGSDALPDTSGILGDMDGGLPTSQTTDLSLHSSDCTNTGKSTTAVNPDKSPMEQHVQTAESIKHNSKDSEFTASSDASPHIPSPSMSNLIEATLTTTTDISGLFPDTESMPEPNFEVPCAPETSVSVETGTSDDSTGSRADGKDVKDANVHVQLGPMSRDFIESSSFIVSVLPGGSSDRQVISKDMMNDSSMKDIPTPEDMDISGFIQGYVENFGEKEKIGDKEEIDIGIVACSSAISSSTPKRAQGDAKYPARRYSIGPPPSCSLPALPLPEASASKSKANATPSGPKHRTHVPQKSILKKGPSGLRPRSGADTNSGAREAPLSMQDALRQRLILPPEVMARLEAAMRTPEHPPKRASSSRVSKISQARSRSEKRASPVVESGPHQVSAKVPRSPLAPLNSPRNRRIALAAPSSHSGSRVHTASRGDQENVNPSSRSPRKRRWL